ncbi:MAG: 4-hydroxy-tetrahydrodipicolinate synthase [Eubacteriaceae bacterium]
MSTPIFEGSCVAMVTPFRNGHVDWDKFRELIDFHIENGTDALLIAGTTGETSTLTDSEHLELLRTAGMYIDGRLPFIAGTGSNDTAYSIMLSQYAEKHGADAVLIINPYYNKSTQKGIIAHVKAIAESIDIPVIVYNVPSRTGANITVDTIVELSKIPNVQGIKEASGNISQVAEIIRLAGDNIDVYSGNDDQALPIMALGGKGVISVSANIIPQDVHEMAQAALDGDYEKARRLQLHQNSLNGPLFYETNPIPVKKAMELMGMDTGEMRLPLIEMSEDKAALLEQAMKDYGILES